MARCLEAGGKSLQDLPLLDLSLCDFLDSEGPVLSSGKLPAKMEGVQYVSVE